MIMRAITCCLLLTTAMGCTAQNGTQQQWKLQLSIVDHAGNAVPGAKVWVAYRDPKEGETSDPFQPNNWAVAGLADINGVFAATHHDNAIALGLHARKEGYYSFFAQHYIGFSPEQHPERLSASRVLTLKKIIHPIPMYAKSVNLGIPAFGKSVGYDFAVGDWVVPNGKGMSRDILFTGYLEKRAENDSDYKLVVSFPNSGDGIQEFFTPRLPVGEGSGLRSPHQAPAEGYQPQWVQTDNRKPGQPIKTDRDSESNYFLRVRTVLDEKGNVKSALYGKIYGDFMQFTYYLNPTPNDRNIEFNPKQNLLKELKATEQVRKP